MKRAIWLPWHSLLIFAKYTLFDRTVKIKKAFKIKYDRRNRRIEKEYIEVIDDEAFVAVNEKTQEFWLKNRKPNDWHDKQKIEITGKDGGPINVCNLLDNVISWGVGFDYTLMNNTKFQIFQIFGSKAKSSSISYDPKEETRVDVMFVF